MKLNNLFLIAGRGTGDLREGCFAGGRLAGSHRGGRGVVPGSVGCVGAGLPVAGNRRRGHMSRQDADRQCAGFPGRP